MNDLQWKTGSLRQFNLAHKLNSKMAAAKLLHDKKEKIVSLVAKFPVLFDKTPTSFHMLIIYTTS